MSCEMAALPFQAHANYGTWSIDFDLNKSDFVFNKNFVIMLFDSFVSKQSRKHAIA